MKFFSRSVRQDEAGLTCADAPEAVQLKKKKKHLELCNISMFHTVFSIIILI